MKPKEKKEDVSLDFTNIHFKTPLVLLSGTAGYGEEIQQVVDLSLFGALICKTITRDPKTGNPPPRTAETPSGLLNSIGLENPGLDLFVKEYLPAVKKLPLPAIISIAGHSRELPEMAAVLQDNGAVGLEVNLSCPNVVMETDPVNPSALGRLLKQVRAATSLSLTAKLPPDLFRIEQLAEAAQDAGCDALTVANTFPAMAFDPKKNRPLLGGVTGGLSGPAILPLSLYLVYKTSRVTSLPIIGSGGIHNAAAAQAMLAAGATALGLGTVNFTNPAAASEILQAINSGRKK